MLNALIIGTFLSEFPYLNVYELGPSLAANGSYVYMNRAYQSMTSNLHLNIVGLWVVTGLQTI